MIKSYEKNLLFLIKSMDFWFVKNYILIIKLKKIKKKNYKVRKPSKYELADKMRFNIQVDPRRLASALKWSLANDARLLRCVAWYDTIIACATRMWGKREFHQEISSDECSFVLRKRRISETPRHQRKCRLHRVLWPTRTHAIVCTR